MRMCVRLRLRVATVFSALASGTEIRSRFFIIEPLGHPERSVRPNETRVDDFAPDVLPILLPNLFGMYYVPSLDISSEKIQ